VEPSITELDASEDDGFRCSHDGSVALEAMYKHLDDGEPTVKRSAVLATCVAPSKSQDCGVEDTFDLAEDSSVASRCSEIACNIALEAINTQWNDFSPQDEPVKGAGIVTAAGDLDDSLQLNVDASCAAKGSAEGVDDAEGSHSLQTCMPPARAYSIAGTWDDGELHDMTWDSTACRFAFRIVLSRRSSASFRILPGGDRRKPLRLRHSGGREASRNRSGETVWTINSDEDCCYVIELALAVDGVPSSVSWTPAPCMDIPTRRKESKKDIPTRRKEIKKAARQQGKCDIGEAEVAAALNVSSRRPQLVTTTPSRRLEDPDAVRKQLAELEAFLCQGPRMIQRC